MTQEQFVAVHITVQEEVPLSQVDDHTHGTGSSGMLSFGRANESNNIEGFYDLF